MQVIVKIKNKNCKITTKYGIYFLFYDVIILYLGNNKITLIVIKTTIIKNKYCHFYDWKVPEQVKKLIC